MEPEGDISNHDLEYVPYAWSLHSNSEPARHQIHYSQMITAQEGVENARDLEYAPLGPSPNFVLLLGYWVTY